MPTARFGSKEFFVNYLKNQIKKDGKTQEVVARVHFAMTSLIFESLTLKEALPMVKNLTEACEELSEIKKGVSYID